MILYKMHARAAGDACKALRGLNIVQDPATQKILPLARWPIGITCRNCLTKFYSDGHRL